MAKKTTNKKGPAVTMRVRVGDAEIEITGPADFVKKEISEFLTQTPGSLPKSPERGAPVTPQRHPLKGKSPAQFFKMSNPRSDLDRTLAGMYFLEKYRDMQNATAAEIRDVIKEAKVPPPANVNDAVNKNIRKGLIMTAGERDNKIVFVLTSDGEAAVEETVQSAKA